MALRRVLVVGCGGSGAATMCFMLDHLQSRLHSIGVNKIPAGWKFVSIDVPVSPQRGPLGLPDVRTLGATYIGTGVTGGYGQIDRAVTAKARSTENGASIEGDLASWLPPKDGWGVVVSDGAGQFRAVGRMLTLAKGTEIRDRLEHAWLELQSAAVHNEMHDFVDALGADAYDQQNPPLVIVLSSMAGGSGASMALDVCRTLAGIHGLDPNLMAVFMVGADVFSTLMPQERPGVYANSLAMLGEIVAAQTEAASATDARVSVGLGIGAPAGIPFRRAFPIGLHAGLERAPFGDGSREAVFRGMGVALGSLISSSQALERFIQYDLANTAGLPFEPDLYGWGASAEDVVWGSLGFASLSMGRDRYAAYAAQRLARGAVDRLRAGHLVEDPKKTPSSEQLNALVRSQFPSVVKRLQLWDGTGSVNAWFSEFAWPAKALTRASADLISANLDLPPAEAQDASAWVTGLRRRVSEQSKGLQRQADDAAHAWAYQYVRELHERILTETRQNITRFGLPYARETVLKLGEHFEQIAPQLRQVEQAYGSTAVDRLDENAERALSGVARVLRNGQALLDGVVDSIRRALTSRSAGRACGLLASALEETRGAFLAPLHEILSNKLKDLDDAVSDKASSAGLAKVATDLYNEWPREDAEPDARFDQAANEILLTTSSQFRGQFEYDIQRANPDQQSYRDALDLVVGQIISGVWPTTGGRQAPGGLLDEVAPARLRTVTDPNAREAANPAPASFVLRVRPSEVLARALAFVERPGESFSVFCTESLRSFVSAAGLPDYERNERGRLVRNGFRSTLDLALPLATPNKEIVQELFGQDVKYRYKFSEIPFAEGEKMWELLNQVLVQDPKIDQTVVDVNFGGSLSTNETVQRIDLFGSYPNYPVLCFDSVLEPAAKEWQALPSFGRRKFWEGRRARALTGVLPVSVAERRTMIAGWYLGQITGLVQINRGDYGQVRGVEVYDPDRREWLILPADTLTPADHLNSHPEDLLPVVLERMLLAVSQVSSGSLEPLAPYRALRRIYDDSQVPQSIDNVVARRRLAGWMAGDDPSDRPSQVIDEQAGQTRAELALELIADLREDLAKQGRATVDLRNPSYRADLVEDIVWALDQLAILAKAEPRPTRQNVLT